jgi:penicillin-binding protein 1A
MDGWFAGYGGNLVAVAWMGYDQPRSLGNREFGSTLALPIWTDYMRDALRRTPEAARPAPEGLVQTDGDWMYQEYASGNAVRSLGVEEGGSFWDRLLKPLTPLLPSAPPPSREDEKEKKRMQELYFG